MNKAEKYFIETLQNLFGVYRISVHHQSDLLKYFKQFKTDFAEKEAVKFAKWLEIKIREYDKIPPDNRPNWVYNIYFDEAYQKYKDNEQS